MRKIGSHSTVPTTVSTTPSTATEIKPVYACRFHFFKILRAEKLRDDDRNTDVHAERDRHEDHRHGVRSAHRRQRVFTRKFARDDAVCDIVKLLERHAQKHRRVNRSKTLGRLAGR